MRVIRFIAVALLVLVAAAVSPCVLPHFCHLKSSIIEVPLTLILIVLLPLIAFRQKLRLGFWLILFAMPVISFVVTDIYQGWLHSRAFPDWLLDSSAIRAKQKAAESRKRADEKYAEQINTEPNK